MTLKAARELGYTKPIFNCDVTNAPEILEIAGTAACTNYFVHSVSADTPDLPPVATAAAKIAVAKYGKFDIIQEYGFNTIYELVQAIQAAQSLDPATVVAAWDKMTTIDTAFGPGNRGGMQNYGFKRAIFSELPHWRLEGGKLLFGRWAPINIP